MNSTTITIFVALITAVIGPTLIEIVKSKLQRKKDEDEDDIVKEMEIDNDINEQIEILLNKLECDRVWISQFHNGGHFYSSGVSIKKFSLFYEVDSVGISKIQQQFQNVPCSFFSKCFASVNENDSVSVKDFSDESASRYGLSELAKQTGCQSVYIHSLKTPTGKFHGTLGVEFVKETHEFSEEELETIQSAANYVSGLLSAIHHKK